MIYCALHSCVSFADRRVTGQIGVTSRTALRGAAYDDRTTVFSLEGPLPAKSGHCGECLHHHERTGFGFFDFTVEQQALSGGRFDLSQARAHYVA